LLEKTNMSKVTFTVKLDENILIKLKKFCAEHGIKDSFFVERAIQEKLAKEELKDKAVSLSFRNLAKRRVEEDKDLFGKLAKS